MEKYVELPYNIDNVHPGFSVDCVVFTFHKGRVKILLTEFMVEGLWSLPGGFMFKDEDADTSAHRILSECIGLDNVFLKQFYLFSDPNRTIMDQNVKYVELYMNDREDGKWLLTRFVTLGYYAFVNYDKVQFVGDSASKMKWFNLDRLPSLYSDHKNIIDTALKLLPMMLPTIQICTQILSPKFTMTEFRRIFETFLNKEYDRRNFQRKVLSEGLVIPLYQRKESRAFNPPYIYAFNYEKVNEMIGDF